MTKWELERSRIWWNAYVMQSASAMTITINGKKCSTSEFADLILSAWEEKFPKPKTFWRERAKAFAITMVVVCLVNWAWTYLSTITLD